MVTERPKTATTLQALELTNGTPLSALLEKGAKKWSKMPLEPAPLVEQMYRRALLRSPTTEEQKLALELREFMGEEALADAMRIPTWRGNIQADHEKAACRADR